MQLSPSLLCSVSYCLLRTKQSLKPCTASKAFQQHDESNTQSIALLTFNEICVQLRTLTAYVPVTRCALCRLLRALFSLPLPPSLLPSSLSLARSLRLSCSPFIFYLNLLFSHLLSVRLLCVVHCLTDSIQLSFEDTLMLFALMYILGP